MLSGVSANVTKVVRGAESTWAHNFLFFSELCGAELFSIIAIEGELLVSYSRLCPNHSGLRRDSYQRRPI